MRKTQEEQVCRLKKELISALTFHPLGKPFFSVRTIHEKFKFNFRVVKKTLHDMETEGLIKLVPRVGIFKTKPEETDVPIIALIIFEYPAPLIEAIHILLAELSQGGNRYKIVQYTFCRDKYFFSNLNLTGINGALLLLPSRQITLEEINWIMHCSIPFLVLQKHFEELPISFVVEDDYQCGALAALHLLKNGHRKLAVIVAEPRLYGVCCKRDGFRFTAESGGASVEVIDCNLTEGEFSSAKVYDVMKQYLKQTPCRFTGVFVITVYGVPGLLSALLENGISVPADVSVIGSDEICFDPTPDCSSSQSMLTTVSPDPRTLVEQAITGLFSLMDGSQQIVHCRIPVSLKIRKSVQPLSG